MAKTNHEDRQRAYLDEALDVAFEGLKHMRASLAYEGTNKDYARKGDEGYRAAKHYQTALGSITTAEQVRLSREKFESVGLDKGRDG